MKEIIHFAFTMKEITFENILRKTLLSIFLIISIFIAKWLWGRRRMSILMSKITGVPSHPLLGNLDKGIALYRKKRCFPPQVYIMEGLCGHAYLFDKHRMCKLWFAFTPVVITFKPEIMEALLSSSTFLDKSWEYKFLEPWLGLGLLTSTGSKWKTRRKTLTPSFHFRILEDFLPVFNEQSLVLVKKLKTMIDKEWVDISPLVALCTLDIICETVMGVHIRAQDNRDSEYVRAIHELGEYVIYRTGRPWLWPDCFFYLSSSGQRFRKNLDTLHSFTRKVIKERKESWVFKAENEMYNLNLETDIYMNIKKRKAFLDLLLDLHMNEQLLSEEDISEEVDTFMFEGHDTISTGIGWALYSIGLYPEIQKKIFEELDGIFAGDRHRPVTNDDLRGMKYLECTLKESQRLFPSVPVIGRKLEEDVTVSGVTIPEGATVHLFLYMLHRNKEEFNNPEVFDPERFLPENVTKRHPYAYIPFSAGPRNCIGSWNVRTLHRAYSLDVLRHEFHRYNLDILGLQETRWTDKGQKFAMMEEKAVVCNILRNFQVVSLDPRDRVHMKVEFVLRPLHPLRLKFIPRK